MGFANSVAGLGSSILLGALTAVGIWSGNLSIAISSAE